MAPADALGTAEEVKSLEVKIVLLGSSELDNVDDTSVARLWNDEVTKLTSDCDADIDAVLRICDSEAGDEVSRAALELALSETALLTGGILASDTLADESGSIVEEDSGDKVLERALLKDVVSSRFV